MARGSCQAGVTSRSSSKRRPRRLPSLSDRPARTPSFASGQARHGASVATACRMCQLLVSATGSETAPAIGDLVDGLKLVNVRAFAPNGTNVAWSCQARK